MQTDSGVFLTCFTLLIGVSVYLRIVAKEMHRREKWLQFRLETQINELKKKQEHVKEEEEKVIVVNPQADPD